MKNKLTKLTDWLKRVSKSKSLLIGIVIIVIAALFFGFRGNGANADYVTIKRDLFVKTVSVSGKIVASKSVDLSFETGGTVASVPKLAGDRVSEGQVIASLSANDVVASKDKALADLEAAKAELLKLQNGASFDAQTDADKQKLINSIISAYTKSDDAVRNKVDQYFRDGTLQYPRIMYTFYDYLNRETDINTSRATVEYTLKKFQALVSDLSVTSYSSADISDAKKYVSDVKSFLDKVAPAVNSFDVGGNLTQSMADKYKADLATARFNVNESIQDITSFESALQAGVADIGVQQARVNAAEATVRSYDAELSKMVIVAPFTGVVSRQDAKVGQAVASNVSVAALISQSLEVEVFVPEVSLPGVALGNKAEVELDAYPDEMFNATIIHIDPAETLRDGVSNYKVRLSLTEAGGKLVSGLTADVFIETEMKPNTLSVPVRSVATLDGKSYVYKRQDDSSIKVEVVLGEKDGKGNAEVISGISEGDTILLNPPQE